MIYRQFALSDWFIIIVATEKVLDNLLKIFNVQKVK